MANHGRPRVRVTPEAVAALRSQGFSYRQIAGQLGIGKTTAARLIKGVKTLSQKAQETRLGMGT